MAQLAHLMQTLPQEIYNQIYEYTFAADGFSNPRTIHETYEPPSILQVDQHSRDLATRCFYGDESVEFIVTNLDVYRDWMQSIPRHEREKLKRRCTIMPRYNEEGAFVPVGASTCEYNEFTFGLEFAKQIADDCCERGQDAMPYLIGPNMWSQNFWFTFQFT